MDSDTLSPVSNMIGKDLAQSRMSPLKSNTGGPQVFKYENKRQSDAHKTLGVASTQMLS